MFYFSFKICLWKVQGLPRSNEIVYPKQDIKKEEAPLNLTFKERRQKSPPLLFLFNILS